MGMYSTKCNVISIHREDVVEELKEWVDRKIKDKEKQVEIREEDLKRREAASKVKEQKLMLWENELARREAGLKNKYDSMQSISTEQIVDTVRNLKRRIGELEACEKWRKL